MPTRFVAETRQVGTLTWSGGGSSEAQPVTAPVLVLPNLLCPSCGGGVDGVEASVGTSAGYFSGHREYYSTLTVHCRGCGRSGGAAFYRGEAYLEPALEDAVRQFLLCDSRPRFELLEKA